MKATMSSLICNSRCKVTLAIADLKRSIKTLESISPRTPRIEAALKKLKETEGQLCRAAKNPAFIENLTMNEINKAKTHADKNSQSQSKRASKPRTIKGFNPEERKKRDQEIKDVFENWKGTDNAFYIKYGKKHNLSRSAIRKIVKS
jgi:hypothetical protein